jgi:hypothetical protein
MFFKNHLSNVDTGKVVYHPRSGTLPVDLVAVVSLIFYNQLNFIGINLPLTRMTPE